MPTCQHADRVDPTTNKKVRMCYRTWRSRGWCVLELYASFMARSKTIPILRITSKDSKAQWMAPYESVLLSLGKTQFSCCQRNHRMSNKADAAITPCDRPRCLSIARPMFEQKIKHLYTHDHDYTRARLVQCLRKRFLSGLSNNTGADSAYVFFLLTVEC